MVKAKSKAVKRAIHRRYSDKRGRADLKTLALCNNINGPLPHAIAAMPIARRYGGRR